MFSHLPSTVQSPGAFLHFALALLLSFFGSIIERPTNTRKILLPLWSPLPHRVGCKLCFLQRQVSLRNEFRAVSRLTKGNGPPGICVELDSLTVPLSIHRQLRLGISFQPNRICLRTCQHRFLAILKNLRSFYFFSILHFIPSLIQTLFPPIFSSIIFTLEPIAQHNSDRFLQ